MNKKICQITTKEQLLDSELLWDFGKGENVFFTSDTHFGHGKILEYCHRPFGNIDKMDEKLIKNWNAVVGENDIVFHLGDFCFGNIEKWKSVLKRLNGKKFLVIGNHDMKTISKDSFSEEILPHFELIKQQMNILIDGWHIYLNHYPFLAFGGAYNPQRKVGQLFGHVHYAKNADGKDCDRMEHLFAYQYDVGVDNNNYTPISWKQVKSIFEQCGGDGQPKNMVEFVKA